jgi:hypothetical protein
MSNTTACVHCGEHYQHAHICSGKIQQNLCLTHQMMYWGLSCQLCDQEQRAQARDVTRILEARISDQDSEISGLRQQIIELRHIVLDVQRASNTSASASEQLLTRVERALAHIQPNPDLLP